MKEEWDRELIEAQLADHARKAREPDPMGKRALFSAGGPNRGSFGTVVLECSSCLRESPVSLIDLAKAAFPMPFTLPRKYHTLMRCPGCNRRTWMRAHWRV